MKFLKKKKKKLNFIYPLYNKPIIITPLPLSSPTLPLLPSALNLTPMDQQNHNNSPAIAGATSIPYTTTNSPAIAGAPYQAAYQHLYHQQQQQQQQLQLFWADQYRDIEQTTDFKNHTLPLARIKKIMKADEDVRMIAAEAPVVFARACEMFILELTHRGWAHAEENKRRTLQKNDIAAAVTRTDVFDFLVDIVPREEGRGEEGVGRAVPGGPADPLYYYVPQ